VDRALAAGMTNYVAKPYDRAKLIELMRNLAQRPS